MATVTGFTAERMLAIEQNTVVGGEIVGDNLLLTRQSGETVNAGSVRGAPGPIGPTGEVSSAQLDAAILASETTSGKGILEQAVVATDQVLAGFTPDTWHDVTGASVTFVPVVGRAYQFEAQVAVSSESSDADETLFDAQILRVGGGTIGVQSVYCPIANRTVAINLSRTIVAPSGWGSSQTFKIQVRDKTAFTTHIKGTVWNTILTVIDVGVM